MPWTLRVLAALMLSAPASAQEALSPSAGLFEPGLVAPQMDFAEPEPDDFAAPVPYAPSEPAPPAALPSGAEPAVSLQARLVEGGGVLQEGVAWRVFGTRPGEDGALPLVADARGGSTTVRLPPGDYIVHAAFGRATATKRISVTGAERTESLVLNAGGLKLDAVVGDDEPVPANRLGFEIMREDDSGELVTIVPKATPGRVLRLPAGTYHVVSRYGGINAVVRADIEVEPGKLTEAVMRHTGAEVTLKLVSAAGGEALANTSWTVLTESGDTVHESIGAFPSIVLAEGNYSAVATHQNRVYSRDFTVEPGADGDVEVQLSDLVEPARQLPPNAGNAPDLTARPTEP